MKVTTEYMALPVILFLLIATGCSKGNYERDGVDNKDRFKADTIEKIEKVYPTDERIHNLMVEALKLDEPVIVLLGKRLADVKGEKKSLIVSSTTWCGPCTKSYPELRKFAGEYEDEVVVLEAVVDEEFGTGAANLLSHLDMTYETGSSFPTGVLLDEMGNHIGKWSGGGFVSHVEKALAGGYEPEEAAREELSQFKLRENLIERGKGKLYRWRQGIRIILPSGKVEIAQNDGENGNVGMILDSIGTETKMELNIPEPVGTMFIRQDAGKYTASELLEIIIEDMKAANEEEDTFSDDDMVLMEKYKSISAKYDVPKWILDPVEVATEVETVTEISRNGRVTATVKTTQDLLDFASERAGINPGVLENGDCYIFLSDETTEVSLSNIYSYIIRYHDEVCGGAEGEIGMLKEYEDPVAAKGGDILFTVGTDVRPVEDKSVKTFTDLGEIFDFLGSELDVRIIYGEKTGNRRADTFAMSYTTPGETLFFFVEDWPTGGHIVNHDGEYYLFLSDEILEH